MKELVIIFLGNLPETGQEQFNQAMELFRKSKGHDAAQLRYNNTLGFSPDRLESLLYELKKLHNITDLQVANAKAPSAPKGKTKAPKVVEAKDKVVQLSEGDTPEEITEKIENAPAVDASEDLAAAMEVKGEEVVSVENKMTSEEIEAQAKGAALEKEKFLKEDLANFDLDSEKYNSIKSFAAILSDYLNEDPKDQKSATLKAFVAEAKKKYSPS